MNAIEQILFMKTDKEAAMMSNILSEKPEAQRETVLWTKEVAEREKITSISTYRKICE